MQHKMREKLNAEFVRIDINQDGQISKDELHRFFEHEKGITDEEVRFKIIDEIYDQVDVNGDGVINKEEFIVKYVETRNKLLERR